VTAASRPHDGPSGDPPWLLASANPTVEGRTIRSRHGQDAVREQGRQRAPVLDARYGRYAIRIDANRPGLYRWVITLEGRSIRNGTAPGRDEAADAVSQALEELPR
jgi:hypothetical protein